MGAVSMAHIRDAAGLAALEAQSCFWSKGEVLLAALPSLQNREMRVSGGVEPNAMTALVCAVLQPGRDGAFGAALLLEAVASDARSVLTAGDEDSISMGGCPVEGFFQRAVREVDSERVQRIVCASFSRSHPAPNRFASQC